MKRIVSLLAFSAILFGALVSVIGLVGARACADTHTADTVDAPPFNLVIVVVDASRSFRVPSKAPGIKGKVLADEALRIVQQLFRDTANQKRRRTDGHDLYYIVAADAASQIIWAGTREQLTELTPQELARKFAVREQFANCTDLEAAMNEVAAICRKHSEAAEVFLLTFSDLVHEPPQKNWRTCAPPTGEPPRAIDWKTLSRAHLGFYFVSKEFPYRPDAKWKLELERRGLQADFFDAAQALSAGVTLNPPPPAVYKLTQAQVETARTQAASLTHTVVSALTWFTMLSAASIAALFVWVSRKRRSASARGVR